MQIALHVTGTEELAMNLRSLDADVKSKFLIRALKKGAAIVRDHAQALASVGKTGSLATSMTVQMKKGTVVVGPNTETHDATDKRKMRNDSIGIFVEGGTVNHYSWNSQKITAAEARRKKKNVITFQKTEQRTPPRPFLKPALEQSAQEVFQAEADEMKRQIDQKFQGA